MLKFFVQFSSLLIGEDSFSSLDISQEIPQDEVEIYSIELGSPQKDLSCRSISHNKHHGKKTNKLEINTTKLNNRLQFLSKYRIHFVVNSV
jgi:hypothetical protein